MEYLLAYGSFRYGFELHHLLRNARFVGKGYADGFDMYDLGGYPGAMRGEGTIVGDVYEVDEATLKLLDEVEGYHGREDDSFVRIKTRVYFDERRRFYYDSVNVYVLNADPSSIFVRRKIESGDFSAYAGVPSLLNYFAYAENTNSLVLEQRGVRRLLKKVKAVLTGYELVFNVPCPWGACANLKENPKGKVCGYLYVITDDELKKLDRAENYMIRYMKEVVKVTDTAGKEYFAYVYVSPNVDYNLSPTADYLNLIKDGLYEEWKGECISSGLK